MNYRVGDYVLLCPEEQDLEQLYAQKNDPEIGAMLGGFTLGYSRAGLKEWLEFHRRKKDEWLMAIRDKETDKCIGHVALYRIDHRVRSCEFGIMIGDMRYWSRGAGRAVTAFAIAHAFRELNMNRIELSLLASNERARSLYDSLGFRQEGVLRQACYKNGRYVDLILMSLLRSEYDEDNTQDNP
jgi:RimJ/RimL family protein N-acetyltransferase